VPSAKFRAIIFDIGRVLVRVDVGHAMAGLNFGPALNPREAWSAIEKDPRWPDWQEGRISPQDWHLHLSKRLGGPLTFEQFTEVWNRALAPEPIQSELFLEKLSKNYRLALLSNTDPIHMSHAEERFQFFRFFPIRIYSFRVGASKPNPLIFREALRACKVHADEAIYIDDVPAYAEAAQRLGMSGVVFQTPERLQADLRNLGVDLD
jgi:HAD superfamily hydrolase (TIGR01509 family)